MVNIAVLGYGTVGSGVVEVINTNHKSINKRAGAEINIKYVLDLRDFPGDPVQEILVHDYEIIANDPEVDIVVEVMGGIEPAYTFVKRALESGKSVCTSNKALVAKHGPELMETAREKDINFLFEASVGGGIPIIRPISQCLAANDVIEIAGILNGTTNFILTKMINEDMSFEDALSLAQQLGYAERNPAADIEGHDACRKICILASLAYGKHVYPDQVHTEGITNISLSDVKYADAWGGVIKLIGEVSKTQDGRLQCIVCPMLIPRDSQLANVDDVFNGIMVRGDATGDVVFYGKGAGKLPTASAVVADVIDCVKHLKARKYLFWEDGGKEYVADYLDKEVSLYVRAKAEDPDELCQKAEKTFGETTRLLRKDAEPGEAAFLTPVLPERKIREKLSVLEQQGIEILNTIRLSDF